MAAHTLKGNIFEEREIVEIVFKIINFEGFMYQYFGEIKLYT